MFIPVTFRRVPIVACGIGILLLAIWGGLLRMGWPWPMAGGPGEVIYHGPLMIGGFLGTLISLERAVALKRLWPYIAPVAAGLGGICLLAQLPVVVGQVLLLIASVVLSIVFLYVIFRQPAMFTITMAWGGITWMAGNALWLAGWPIPAVVPWWIAFLVLTIVGERLELSRFLPNTPRKQATFTAAAGLYLLGVILTTASPGLGWAVAGGGWIAMALWLVIYDLARRTIRSEGLTRFAAACLLSGYFWMALGGGLAIYFVAVHPVIAGALGQSWLITAPSNGLIYDAILHSVLLGFVFAMIFGHAPIIFPAVLNARMLYRPRFYAHLALLEVGVALRIAADLADLTELRQWAGLLNGIAIVLFLMQTVSTLRLAATPRHSHALDAR